MTTTTQPDQVKELLAKRTEAQRELKPYLERYEEACQELEREIARVSGRPARRLSATVAVCNFET